MKEDTISYLTRENIELTGEVLSLRSEIRHLLESLRGLVNNNTHPWTLYVVKDRLEEIINENITPPPAAG